jgi:SIR2-like domain
MAKKTSSKRSEPERLKDSDWDVLLSRIEEGRCTPFLGAGACHPTLPLGAEIAREWAKEYGYPFEDDGDLVRVAQFVAMNYDPMWPKSEILRRIEEKGLPDFTEPDEPHRILAELPLPVYMTTNYDDFMMKALERHPMRRPRRALCRWNTLLKADATGPKDDPSDEPNPANPVVFHLHGHSLPESVVLTEDDYLEFLASIAQDPNLLPRPIRNALDRSSLLFIGYRLADWNFRVLLQGLRTSRQRFWGVIVLRPPSFDSTKGPPPARGSRPGKGGAGGDPQAEAAERRTKAMGYMERYYHNLDLKVYWGTAREFCGDLWMRWQQRRKRP